MIWITLSLFSLPLSVSSALAGAFCPPSYIQNFDTVTPPALPAGWAASQGVSVTGAPFWVTSNVMPHTSPNDAFSIAPGYVLDNRLDTPSFNAGFFDHTVLFRSNYNLQSGRDGAVLEVSSPSVNGGAFTDIADPAVNGSFSSGGYNSVISTGFQSPIAGRAAWSGDSGGYVNTRVYLGNAATTVGQPTKLRFRVVSDSGGASEGWRIDTFWVLHFECPTPTPTATTAPTTPSPTPTPGVTPPPPSPTPTPSPICDVAAVLPGNGASTTLVYVPSTGARYARVVYLITPAEVAASGYPSGSSPTTIRWRYQFANTAGSAPLMIYLQNTSDTANTKSTSWAAAISGMTLVHNATTVMPGSAGFVDVPLTGGSPFTYTGQGLYVAFDWGPYTGTLGTAQIELTSVGPPGNIYQAQSNSSAPLVLGVNNFRPETRLNFTQTDAAISLVYSYGELPLGAIPAQYIEALVTNRGTTTLTNLPVTLTVSGANTFNDTLTVPTLPSCGGQAMVTFAPFTPAALGSNTVQVSVPNDDVVANNTLSKMLNVTALDYSYKYPGSIATGSVGVNGATGAFVAKFTTTQPAAITAVKLEFASVTATTYRVAIYGDSGAGTPSTTPLYIDAADRTVSAAGPVTINLPSAVALGSGDFYAGIQQTNNTNANLSADTETPVRTSGAFFLAVPNPPTSWSEFSPTINLKLNVGVVLQPAATPPPTIAISGTISYCSNPAPGPVPNVILSLMGDVTASTLSDSSGNYLFSSLPAGGSYTVTPTKANLIPGSAGINTTDVVATQRHFLAIGTPLSGCRLTAADVNGDAAVNTVDVIAIQRFFLILSTGTANVGKYQLTPATRSYPGVLTNQTNQNYDTLVLGDVVAPFVEP